MRYVGIDPGLSGAIAMLADVGENGVIWAVYDMPVIRVGKRQVLDVTALVSLFMKECGRCSGVTIAVEKASAMPKQGVVSTFHFGEVFGAVQGVLSGLQLPFTLVSPQLWKSRVMSHMPKEKGSSIIVAKRLYPDCAEFLKRVKDHGRADALLLAHYARMCSTPKLEHSDFPVGVALPF